MIAFVSMKYIIFFINKIWHLASLILQKNNVSVYNLPFECGNTRLVKIFTTVMLYLNISSNNSGE